MFLTCSVGHGAPKCIWPPFIVKGKMSSPCSKAWMVATTCTLLWRVKSCRWREIKILKHERVTACDVTDVTSAIETTYRIVGNFGEVFNLANWRFCGKLPNLKPANIISYTVALCGVLAIAKFKIC